MQYLFIRDEEVSVVSITAKVCQSFGNESLILVQPNDFKIEDTDTTKSKFYFKGFDMLKCQFSQQSYLSFICILSCL